jgi:hypothetical protein
MPCHFFNPGEVVLSVQPRPSRGEAQQDRLPRSRRRCAPACAHVCKSGRLRFDPSGLLTAWLVCDDCDQTLDFMRHQTAEVQHESKLRRTAA